MKPEKKPARKTAAKPKAPAGAPAAKPSRVAPAAKAKTGNTKSAAAADAEKGRKVPTPRKSAARPASEPQAAPPAPPKKVSRKKLEVPPILLEGDAPSAASPSAPVGGPGSRYVLGQQGSGGASAPSAARSELPESYGTQRLFIAARDPHWLYCSWDFTREQQRRLNNESRDGHLVIRVFSEEAGASLPEVHVHPESRSWFLYVPKAECRYHAELGYYDAKSRWKSASVSRHTFTPAEAPSTDITAEFATIPARVSFKDLVETVQDFLLDNRPLLNAIAAANASQPGMAPANVVQREDWTPLQIAEVAQLVSIDRFRRVWMGSLEITEMIRRRLQEDNASIAAAELARAGQFAVGAESSLSSPFGGEAGRKERGFWFNINAELIIYGATDAGATVTIGERQIKLRPDGSFSFRFALPDGNYTLPVAATSSDKEETRKATLQFTRSTGFEGDVRKHPQDPRLRKPSPKNVK